MCVNYVEYDKHVCVSEFSALFSVREGDRFDIKQHNLSRDQQKADKNVPAGVYGAVYWYRRTVGYMLGTTNNNQ